MFSNNLALALSSGLALLNFGLIANASSLVLTQDEEILLNGVGIGINYVETQDAELREDSPDGNFDLGTGSLDPEFTVDGEDPDGFANSQSQAVLRFDNIFGNQLGQIPSNVFIESAFLFIDIDNTGDDLILVDLLQEWGSETDVTWNTFGSDGVTLNSDGSFNQMIPGDGNNVFLDVTNSLNNWLEGTPNNGWAFLPTGSDGVDFDASENSDPLDRPSLFVTFQAIPEPNSMLGLLILTSMGLLSRYRKLKL